MALSRKVSAFARLVTDADYARVEAVLDLTGAPESGYTGKASIVVKLGVLLTG